MAGEERFSKYFGFSQGEVEDLFKAYKSIEKSPRLSLEELGEWYDGYQTFMGDRVYNPRSVIAALTNNNLGYYGAICRDAL